MNPLRVARFWPAAALLLLISTAVGCGGSAEQESTASTRLYPVVRDGQWGYIDAAGTMQIAPAFEAAWPFVDNDRALIQQDGQYGYVNRTGTVVIAPQYADAWHFTDGFAPVQPAGQAWTFIDPSGAPIAPDRFQLGPRVLEADESPPSLQRVRVDGQYGYRDAQGEMIIHPRFEQAWYFTEGRARVQIDGQWGYIDRSGAVVIDPQFDRAWDFSGPLALVHTAKGYGYIDRSGAYIWPPTQ